jgi:predicted DNA-binding protein with PD1-like motif
MQVFKVTETRFLLKLQMGEEAMETLRRFADAEKINAGVLRGIGACLSAKLAYFNMPEKQYETFGVEEVTEVVSFLGNFARGEDGQSFVHVHTTLGRRDGTTIAGHVMSLVVGATLEIDLEVLPGTLRRRPDPSVNLPLQHGYE